MAHVFEQSTGSWFMPDGTLLDIGYSGYKDFKNKPQYQDRRGIGCIPEGFWKITEMLDVTDTHGPFVLVLAPEKETKTFGRSGFLIHGDSIAHPGSGSHGCIVLSRHARRSIWSSGDKVVNVVPVNKPPVKEIA